MFRGGTIWTGTDGASTDALTVVDGVIEGIGEQAQRVAGQHGRVEEVDLDGGFLMPSFGDGHAHPLLGGLEAVGPPIRPCRSVAEIVEAVRVFAESAPRRRVDRRRLVRRKPRARQPFRRPVARRGCSRPAGDAARMGLPHRLVQLGGARARRHHRGHARSGARRDPASRGRIGVGHATGMGRSRSRDGSHAGPRPGRPGRGVGHGRRLLPGAGCDVGAGRLGGPGRRRHLPRRRAARRAPHAFQPRVLRRPAVLRFSAARLRRGATSGRRAGVADVDRADGEVLRRWRRRERDRCAVCAVLLVAAQPRHAGVGG